MGVLPLVKQYILLLNPKCITFGNAMSLNPATLLPNSEPTVWVPHDCHQILAEYHGTRGYLSDFQLPDVEHTWFTDGSSFLKESERRAGMAVVDVQSTIWAQALPPGASTQNAELIALTKTLELAKGQKVSIYTDSCYTYAMAPVHGKIYKRRCC